jgi:hypothetical protein
MNALKPAEDIDSGSLVLIREILVTHVGMDYRPMIKKKKISPPRPERVGDQTWRVTYTVFLNCPTPNRIKRHTRAFGHVSDDKVHDRHAMQHFTKQELEELEKYMKQYFPDDIPQGRILRLHQHSDNASQHFKSTGALHFFTCLTTRITTLSAYVYSFGAPGHGKGPWDGVGGRWKSKVDQCSSSSETQGRLSYTDSGYIQSVKDVFMALQYHFERGEQRDMQLAGKNPIHGYQFFMYTHDHNPI